MKKPTSFRSMTVQDGLCRIAERTVYHKNIGKHDDAVIKEALESKDKRAAKLERAKKEKAAS